MMIIVKITLKIRHVYDLSLKLHNDASHIVAANSTARGNVSGDDPIEDVFDYLRDFLLFLVDEEIADSVDGLVRAEAVPDTIAGNNKESRIVDFLLFNLRHGCDHLLCQFKLSVRLILEVTEGAGKVQHTLHSVILNETSCGLNSILFSRKVWLVVLAHGDATELASSSLWLAG